MSNRTIFSLLGAAMLMSPGVAWAAPTPSPTVRTLAAKEARLAAMAYRIATASPDLCVSPQMMTGLIVHDLTQYHPSRRGDVARAFSLGAGFGVLELVQGSAAAKAGLRIDDEIIGVGPISLEEASISSQAQSFRRVQHFSDLLRAQLSRGPAELRIRRAGQLMNIMLTGEPGCGGDLALAHSASLNAWADGHHVVVTTGMSEFAASDDEIAFVIAHEMAHNILNHSHGRSKAGFFGGLNSRKIELAADRFSVTIMARAGYEPAAGISFLERSRKRMWWAFSLSHPGFATRIRKVGEEIRNWSAGVGRYREVTPRAGGHVDIQIASADNRLPKLR